MKISLLNNVVGCQIYQNATKSGNISVRGKSFTPQITKKYRTGEPHMCSLYKLNMYSSSTWVAAKSSHS